MTAVSLVAKKGHHGNWGTVCSHTPVSTTLTHWWVEWLKQNVRGKEKGNKRESKVRECMYQCIQQISQSPVHHNIETTTMAWFYLS